MLSAAPDFTGPLKGKVGRFLTWDPNIAPLAPAGFSADGTIPHQVVGATFNDPVTGQPYNKIRLEYLDGALNLDGAGHNFTESTCSPSRRSTSAA